MSKLIDEVIRPFLDKEQLSEYGEKYYWPTTKIPYEKGTGYDSADKARGTIDSVKGKSKNYQSYVINSMYKRAKHHISQTAGMKEAMEVFDNWIVEQETKKIKKVVGIYGGRFQPFGPHHKKTFEWLEKQVDVAYITTSDIKELPRHPMNFKEKVRHMTKMGIPSNKIIKEKSPYVGTNTLKKFDKESTAVIYIFGAKDAGRLVGGTKKSGGKTYYQDYKKNKNNLEPAWKHGYILTAPHVTIKAGGLEVSGTSMRQLLGHSKYEGGGKRQKLFKKMFGYFDKGVFTMMTNKFRKLYEAFDDFLMNNDIKKIIKEGSTIPSAGGRQHVDDGPRYWWGDRKSYENHTKRIAGKLGWEVVNYIMDNDIKMWGDIDPKTTDYPGFYDEDTYEGEDIDPGGPTGAVSYGPTGMVGKKGGTQVFEVGSLARAFSLWEKHIASILKSLGWEIVDYMGAENILANTMPEKDHPDDTSHTRKTTGGKAVKEIVDITKEAKLLVEGGAYGHMAHPFDDNNLTFGDLKKIITDGLGGNLNREDNVSEKLDGQNLMISWRDGKLIAARNKGHLKNAGETALDTNGIISKFKGRGDISDAFSFAMKDLEKAIGSLSDKQRDKIFMQGKAFMNLEVMWPKSSNVINYDKAEIVFHGALEYDDIGTVVGEVKGSGRILEGMIRQVNQHIQKHYKIGKPVFLEIPKNQDFGTKKRGFISRLIKLQKHFALKDTDTLSMYHQSFWEEFIFNAAKQFGYKIPIKVLKGLVKRWAFFDKKYGIRNMKKDIKDEDFLDWVLSTDKQNHQKMFKDNIKPFEVLFFEVGAEILKNITGYMAANPDSAVQKIRKTLKKSISSVRASKDAKKLNTLKQQLDKLNSIGGIDAIVPSEGIVFKYKGNTYKFTGAFAPINQITGLITF